MRRDGKEPKERCCLVQKFCTFESLARPGAHERVWKGLREQKRRCKPTIEIVGGIGPGMKCAEKFSQRKRCFKPSYAHSLASVLLYAFRSREKEYCLFCGFFQLEKPICYWESRQLLAPLMSQLVTFSNCSPGVIVVWVIFSHWSVGPLTREIKPSEILKCLVLFLMCILLLSRNLH